MFRIVLTLATLAVCAWAQTADYCATSLCSGKTHIACGNTGTFVSTCAADRELIPIGPFINDIVNMHNNYRNIIASGGLTGFLSATRMATMEWDSELAYLAELNVKQCQMKHDQCRNTDRFKWSGQNLAWYWSSPAATPTTAITTGIQGWWNEFKDAKMEHINSYQSVSPTIGHFTPIANDRNRKLGCALMRQSKSGGTEYVFACNYVQTNILNRKVYNSGTAASGCTTGTNPAYPALCSISEPIDPNTVL